MEVESIVDEVCVFREGARVSRRATIPSQVGQYVIKNLPLCLNDDSLALSLSKVIEGITISHLTCCVDLLAKNEPKKNMMRKSIVSKMKKSCSQKNCEVLAKNSEK